MTRTVRARLPIFVSLAALAALALLQGGCGSNDNRVAPPDDGRRAKRGEFELALTGLGDPSPAHYEAWFVVGGQPKSGGKFRVTSAGKISDLAGTEVPGGILRAAPTLDLSGATAFFITLEPDDDASAAPSATRVLGGAFAGATANLDVANTNALGVSFTGADGSYYLDSPTTETVKDFNRGIVFQLHDCGEPGRATSDPTNIPALPASGWSYEGWIMRPSGAAFIAYSTGRFRDPCGFDSDRAGQGAGTFGEDADGDGLADGLAVPAQDFVDSSGSIPPLVLDEGGLVVAVSIEPEPDNLGAPFFLRILDTEIPAAQSVVTLTQSGLSPIGDGHFELWHRTESNQNLSIGKFRVNESGGLVALDGAPISSFTADGDLLLSQRLFITVEPEGDPSAAPSRSTMLTGALRDSTIEFGDSTAVMRPDFAVTNAAFDEVAHMGAYFLNTFTTIDTTDWANGIWFFKTHPGEQFSDSTTLLLPVLRDGWVYEGWVERISTGDAYSTGRFLSAGGSSDGDFAGLTAGTDGIDLNQDGRADGPLYPGQDFVQSFGGVPALDLDNGDFRAFLSIEPSPDVDSIPFIMPVLEDALVDSLGSFITQPLERSPVAPPSAVARISRGPVTRALANRASNFPTGRVTIGTGTP